MAFLVKEKGTTVLLTTHYIEEANQSDIVGIMRDGHLIAEDKPARLIEQYSATSLETAFLTLCKIQEPTQELLDCLEVDIQSLEACAIEVNASKDNDKDTHKSSLNRVCQITEKNIRLLSRNIW